MVEVEIEILQRERGCETEGKRQIPPSHQLVAGGDSAPTPAPLTLATRHPSRMSKALSCGLDQGLEPVYQKKVRKVSIRARLGFL